MLRNIHFFNLKPGAAEKRILYLMDVEFANYAKSFGCLGRKTWKLLDAHAGGQDAESAMYMNEALWPSQKDADAFSQAERSEEVAKLMKEWSQGAEIVKTLRYVDDEG